MGTVQGDKFYSAYLGQQIDLLLAAMAEANPLPSGTNWVAFIDDCEAAQEAAETAQQAAEAAAAAAETWSSIPPYIDQTTGNWFVYDTQSKQFVNSGVHAQGDKGDTGDTGNDGVSPSVTVTSISGGHRVSITDATGTQTFDVLDGTGVSSFNNRTGAVIPTSGDYTAAMVGLGNVNNTSDADKPISTATQAALNAKAEKPVQSAVSLSVTWSGSGPYTQTVSITGATANSKIDLQPTAAQLQQLIDDGVQALYISNNNGTLTATALGAAPTAALTLQCTLTEVTA